MGSLSLPKPLLAALSLVVAFAAVWMVALRPHTAAQSQAPAQPHASATVAAASPRAATATAPGLAPDTLTGRAVASARAASEAQAAHRATAPARAAHPRAQGRRAHHARAAAPTVTVLHGNHTAAAVDAALRSGRVLALLLFNPAGADDQADLTALGAVSDDHGHVVKLAAPIAMVSKLSAVTTNVQVTTSPTLLIVDRRHQATTVTGFVDPLEYQQAIAAALAAGE